MRAWQQELVELVRAATTDRRTSANVLTFGAQGLGVALAVLVLTRDADAAGPAAAAARPGRALLDAVLGGDAVAALVTGRPVARPTAHRAAGRRPAPILDLLDGLGLSPDAAEHLRAATRRVDDRRFEQARLGGDAVADDNND